MKTRLQKKLFQFISFGLVLMMCVTGSGRTHPNHSFLAPPSQLDLSQKTALKSVFALYLASWNREVSVEVEFPSNWKQAKIKIPYNPWTPFMDFLLFETQRLGLSLVFNLKHAIHFGAINLEPYENLLTLWEYSIKWFDLKKDNPDLKEHFDRLSTFAELFELLRTPVENQRELYALAKIVRKRMDRKDNFISALVITGVILGLIFGFWLMYQAELEFEKKMDRQKEMLRQHEENMRENENFMQEHENFMQREQERIEKENEWQEKRGALDPIESEVTHSFLPAVSL